MKPKCRRLSALSIGATTLISLAMTAHSADLYWDGADVGLNADGGAGTWNTTSGNWDTLAIGGANAVWNNATPDNAFFTGVGGTVSLGTAITAGTVNVGGPAYSFTGSTLTADSINVATGFSATFGTVAGRVSNTVAINGGGGSLVVWNGGSTISTVNLNSGILRNGTTASSATINIGGSGLLEWSVTNPTPTAGSATNIVLNRGVFRTIGGLAHGHVGNLTFNGGLLDFTAGGYNSESLQLNNSVTAGTGGFVGSSWIVQTTGDNASRGLALKGARTFTVNANNDLRVQAELENSDGGSDSLIKAGDGRMILLNTSSYIGGTTINGGTLQLGDFSAAGTGTGTAITNGINGGTGTVTVNASGTLAASHVIGTGVTYLSNLLAGTGTLRVDGAGHFGLSGNTNTFSGTVNLRSSGLIYGGLTLDYTAQNNNKLGTGATLNLNGGNLRVLGNASAATAQTVGAINVLGGGLITLNPGTGQTATLTATTFSQSGSGMLLLRTAGTLGTTANFNVGSATFGRWATTQNTTEQNTAFLTKDESNNAVALQFTASAAASAEAAGTGTLASQGTTSVFLNNTNQTITSNLTIDSIASQNDVFVNNGAVLTLNGGGIIQRNAAHWIQTGAGARGSVTTGLGTGELFVTSGLSEATDFRINTNIVDNGLTPTILVKGGTGQLILGSGGANSYTGGTIINSGRLQLTNVGALGTGDVTVRPSGQLYLNVGGNTFARNMTLSGIGSADGSANNFGALRVDGSPTVSGTLTANDHARITLGTSGGTVGFTGITSGAGDLEIRSLASGLSFAVFTNASNTFSGRWIVRDGNSVLRVASDAAFGAVPSSFRNDSIILDGGRLQFGSTGAGASFTLNANRGISLPNSGTTGFFHVWGGQTMTIAGGISGPGNMEKTDGGTLVLQGLNTNTGNVRVTAGALNLASGGSFTQLNNLQLAGTMNITAGSSVVVRNQLITSDASGGVTTLNQTGGDLSVLGSTIADERNNAVVFTHWNANTTFNHSGGTFNVLNAPVMLGWDGTVTWNISGTATANIRGIFGQNRSNAATINLTGGRLNIGSSGVYNLAATKLIKLGAGTVGALADWSSSLDNFRLADATTGVTFDPSGRTISLTGILSNETGIDGKLNLNGEGTLVLGGANTYTGGTSITLGTLQLNNASGLGASTNALTVDGGTLNLNANSITTGALAGTGGIITDNSAGAGISTLIVSQAASTTYSGNIADGAAKTVAFEKSGAGTLGLNATSTYTGATNVAEGRLNVNGSITSATSVDSDAILGGDGTINGAVSLSGTLLAGQGGSTDRSLTINGNVTTNAGSVLSFTIDAMNDHDSLVISGGNSIGLANADLYVTFDTGLSFTGLAAGEGADFLAAISSDDFSSIGATWFRIIEGNTTGMFANVTSTLSSGELSYLGLSGTHYAYDADNGQRFWVAQGSTYLVAIPEPRAALLGGLGFLLILRRRRNMHR
jgi:autotransporter-associated beta strand protein